MTISVIISTYNNPGALEKSLWGFRYQTYQDFEILIADDGSTSETRAVVEAAAKRSANPLTHVWHEDRGFRKGEILNKAIRLARGDYLIFTDGDCIARDDFVLSHKTHARPNYYISGGSHIDIPASVYANFNEQDVAEQRVFDAAWLAERGAPVGKCRFRLTRYGPLARLLDALTPRPGVFLGCNASAWKKDILAVNGFDSSFTYGSDDKELGVRLTNKGVRSRRLRYSLVCIHQSHPRNYSSPSQILANRRKLQRIKRQRIVWVDHGLDKLPPAPAQHRLPHRAAGL